MSLDRKLKHTVFEAAGWKCAHCGRGGRLTLDHIIPRARGGKDERSNLQALCSDCNRKKADKPPDQYVPGVYAKCMRCDGRGVLDKPFGRRCVQCDGTGRIERTPTSQHPLKMTKRQRRVSGIEDAVRR